MYAAYLLCLFFVAVTCNENPSECQTAREKELKNTAPGHFVPSCEADGTYSNLQCHAGTNFCQCWTKNGDALTQPSNKIKKCNCIVEKHEALSKYPANSPPPPGAYIPQCEDNGGHKEQQCNPSTGLCWCVNENGDKLRDLDRGADC